MTTMTAGKRGLLFAGGALVVLAVIGGAVAVSGKSATFEEIAMSAEELTSGEALVVDIRTPAEWAETGVLEGAVLFTFTNVDRFLGQIEPALADGRDLVLICRSDNRSGKVANLLAGRIPNRIISVDGGMKRVMSEGYQTVAPGG